MNERLTGMQTDILSRTSLSDLIQRLNLYPKQGGAYYFAKAEGA